MFLFLISRLKFFRLPGFGRFAIPIVFILKIAAGVIMYIIYTRFYTDRSTADIFKYFDDSKVMYDALWAHPADYFKMLTGFMNDSPYFDQYYQQMNNWYRVFESNIYNDSHTIIRFNAFVRIFSFGYYQVHTVFMCFISLTGLVALYRFFSPVMPDRRRELFFAVFLIPSVVFWGSGVLKEGLLLFGMGMLLYATGKLLMKKQIIRSIFWIVVSGILLMYTKYYILILMLPLLAAYVWSHFGKAVYIVPKYFGVMAVALFAGLNIHLLFPGFDILNIIAQKQNDFVGLAEQMNSGSLITQRLLKPELGDMIVHAPGAFYNTLVRPYVFESSSPLILLSAIENLLIIILLMFSVMFASARPWKVNTFYFVLFFFVATYIFTGLTTPVTGALVRYKVPAMPFLLIFIIMLADKTRILKKFPFLVKFFPL